jgi:ketosteroid isomerase-like protein
MTRLGRPLAVALLVVLVSTSARADNGVLSAARSDEQRLRELTVEWMAAVARKDTRRLEEIMAPDYTLEMPGALERVGRSEWVRNAIGRQWGNFRYDNVSVGVEGTQAIVTSRLYFKVSPIPVTLDSGIVDVWVKRNDQWRIKTRYLAASDFFTKVTFAAGVLANVLLFGTAAVLFRLLRQRQARRNIA